MNKKKLILVILLILAFILRVYQIKTVPSSLYYDEVDYGYQARSLIETGKDYRGGLSPFYVHSFNDIRAPILAFLNVPTTLIFSSPELQVRMPNVILGTTIVLMIFLIINLWTKNLFLAFVTSLVFATNPWQIQFSRFNHEVISMAFFYLLSACFFYKWLEKKEFKNLVVSTILFSLTVYTYRTMSFYIPVTFFSLFVIYRIDLLKLGSKLLLLVFIALAIVGPFLYATTIGAPDLPRIAQLAISSDPQIPIWIKRNREVDSGDSLDATLGKSPTTASFFFHNKLFSWLDSFSNNFAYTFSTDFLITKGDYNKRHSVGQMGEIFYLDIIAFIAGLFLVFKNLKLKYNQLLLTFLFTSPLPAALTSDGAGHGARLFIFSLPLLITIGFGWYFLINLLKNISWGKLILISMGLVWALLFIFYLHRLFVHFPIESARNFGFGFKEVVLKINKEDSKYKKIVMSPTSDPPMIYYLFWSKTPPKLLQEYGTQFSEDVIKGYPLDKYKVTDLKEGFKLDSEVLYLVTPREFTKDLRKRENLPSSINLVDLVKYPDGEVAFYLLSKTKD